MTTTAPANDIAGIAHIMHSTRRDPVPFIEHVIGDKLWDRQRQIARDVFRHRRVAVKACNSSGKTYIAARIALAWFFAHPMTKIVTTAATWDGVKRQLWGELTQAFHQLPAGMRRGIDLLQTELRAGPDWWAIGLSTDEGIRFQGHHAETMLVILDEANGVRSDIWEAAFSLGAGGNVHYLVIANPLEAAGPFYELFTDKRADWLLHTIDAFDTPNLAGLTPANLLTMDDESLGETVWPALITRRYVRDLLVEAGEESAVWQARVRGEFPTQSDVSLFALSWCERARQHPAADDGSAVVIGVDVAGPGDDETVAVVRQEDRILAMRTWRESDSRGLVTAYLREWQSRLSAVNVDSAGLGHYFAAHLRDQGYPVRSINVAVSPSDEKKRARFLNLRAELYVGLRDKLRDGLVSGLADDRLISQLTAIRHYTNSVGKTVIESKDEARKRGVKSPDRADALMLAFATDTPAFGIVRPPDAPAAYVRRR